MQTASKVRPGPPPRPGPSPGSDPLGTGLDTASYLARIGYHGILAPTAAVLSDLHFAHITHIPFSTLELLFGPPAPLELRAIQEKLVDHHRGGFCIEHHVLFSAVLRRIGFPVTVLAARVRNAGPAHISPLLPRPHILLSVAADGRQWLADVCFGGGPLRPLPLRLDEVTEQDGETFRIVRDGPEYVLQSLRPDGPLDLYGFSPFPQTPAELTMYHHFGTTHRDSVLLNHFWAHRPDAGARWTFHLDEGGNTTLIEKRADRTVRRRVAPDERADVLATHLGLRVPDGFRFPARPPVAGELGPARC